MLQITISKRAALIIGIALLLVIPGVATATHIFTDVVDGSTHAPGIEWVANAGVSTGCGDGSTYCPNDNVTRAQMGTFMCRLAGNCGVAPSVDAATAISATSADDADTVDGYEAEQLKNAVSSTYRDWSVSGAPIQDDPAALITHTFNVPVDGYAAITASHGWYASDTSIRLVAWLQLDDATCVAYDGTNPFIPGSQMWTHLDSGGHFYDHTATSAVVAVTAGDHTLTICVDPDRSTGTSVGLIDGNITVVLSAEGASGGILGGPAAVTATPGG